MSMQATADSSGNPSVAERQLATEELSITEFRKLNEVLATSLDAFAALMNGVGEVELRTGQRFSDIAMRMSGKEFIAQAVKVLRPEQLGVLLRILVRMSTIGDLSIDKLSPQEKMAKASELKEISADIREFSQLVTENPPATEGM
jgi:hypothetical protein